MMLHSSLKHRILIYHSYTRFIVGLIVYSSSNIFLKDGMGISYYFSFLLYRPMSVTIYVSNDTDEISEFEKGKQTLPTQSTFRYSVFYSNSDVYSYNQLRNIAVKNSITTHIYISDMDFWPSSIPFLILFINLDNLYESFMSLSTNFLSDDWLAIIVPAFQYYANLNETQIKPYVAKYYH